ncbi:hypothetical protein B9X75_08550 [Acinetobacter pittii]|uniref:phage structural protein n=1 Tax=Acinetobacter pittii TaxID=48296 RepID=UPI000838A675|nr:phage protein [Acinetobacter pittii]MCK0901028.1 DUF3277 family protein [Acinetobacter pittii]OCY99335.1 hypothetical protein BFR94_02290 [Acinetobacter pittii]OTL34485.1 hypothetical protein B9X75_08550 [Acinetobacter pittii]OTM18232.1 hypothetical protein B9X53_06680 [Acinetobacter pittii]
MSTYSFMDTQCTLASDDGVIDLGYGAGVAAEGITIAMAADANTMTIGADGEGMHSLSANKSGTVTVRLLKTSPVNAKLSNLYHIQRSSTKKWGKNTITLNHTGSGDNATATKCAFKKHADLAYKEVGDFNEWAFDAIKINQKLGAYD